MVFLHHLNVEHPLLRTICCFVTELWARIEASDEHFLSLIRWETLKCFGNGVQYGNPDSSGLCGLVADKDAAPFPNLVLSQAVSLLSEQKTDGS